MGRGWEGGGKGVGRGWELLYSPAPPPSTHEKVETRQCVHVAGSGVKEFHDVFTN